MIIKSWHNYSVKFHSNSKRKPRNSAKVSKNRDMNESLNESCASDILEADY